MPSHVVSSGWLGLASWLGSVTYDRVVAAEGESAPGESAAGESAAGESAADGRAGSGPRLRGVITDWGGVMTNPIAQTVDTWLEAEQIDRESYHAVVRPWVTQAYGADEGENPVHALERGERPNEDFEAQLAARLVDINGLPVSAVGLLKRMFAASVLDVAMQDLLRALRRAGLRTAMLSNSWGAGDYPRHLFPELFDAVVISCEVGMRKPEERIFRLAAELLGLEPAECVFIDDIEANVLAAEAVGLVGLQHHQTGSTVERLSELLGIPLA
jgi:putative hydrolase of the HAD superfamily